MKENRVKSLGIRKILVISLMLLSLPFGISLLVSDRASAVNNSNLMVSKAAFEGVITCLREGAYKKTFFASNPEGFLSEKAKNLNEAVKLPYGLTSVKDNNLNCKEVLFGYDSSSDIKGGLIPDNVKSATNVEVVKGYFAGNSISTDGLSVSVGSGAATDGNSNVGLGFVADAISEESESVSKTPVYTIKSYNCSSGTTDPVFNGSKNKITFPTVALTESGLAIENYNDINSIGETSFSSNCNNLFFTVNLDKKTENSIVFNISWLANGITNEKIKYTKKGSGVSVSSGFDHIKNLSGDKIEFNEAIEDGSKSGNEIVTDYRLVYSNDLAASIAFIGGLNKNNRAGISVGDYSAYSNLAFDSQEFFDLYTYYIQDVFGAEILPEEQATNGGVELNICSDRKYFVDKTKAKDVKNVYGIDTNSHHFTAGPLTIDDVISALNGSGPYGGIDNGGRCGTSGSGSGSSGGSGSSSGSSSSKTTNTTNKFVDCNTLKNLGAMQWILCPVMNNEQYTASWIDKQTQDWLEIKTEIYDDEKNPKIKEVWDNIRNIANVIMILFLLVIILSQVTGYGIDNYGIKKMLPRLIVIAVAINLSFYICQMAVDLSNIIGVGLRNMLTGIGMTVGDTDPMNPGFISDMVMGIFAAAGTGGPAAIAAFTALVAAEISAAAAAVIMVIVLLLVVIVAVMILFLMLGAREIMVIVCIIVSPLAFAAYVLPNTQNLFKKWWELFKAALIIFPICGAMGGVSNLLRGTFTENTELSLPGYAILLVLPYLGFFLLPMLLKNAISALGKVGGALTSIGNTVKNSGKAIGQGAAKVGRNTNAFKDWQMKNQERRAANVIEKVRRKGSKATDGDLMRAKEAQDLLNKRKLDRYLNTDKDGRFYGLELGDGTAESRANAIKESQELRNYSDQYTNLTRGEMGGELTAAITAYNNDRSDENRIRLQAALMAADGKGMNKETLAGLGEIKFDSSNKNDEKILSTLAGASDKVLSQYGIQMNKMANPDYKHKEKDANGVETERELTDEERKISLNDFIRSGSEVKLSKVSSDKGSSWLNGANDDTWDTVLKINPNAVDTQTLITAANNTTDGKVVTEIKKLLETRNNAGIQENYNMSAAELANLKPAIADALRDTGVYKNAVESIRNNPDSAANQQILNSMDATVRVKLKLDDNSLAEARRTLQVRRNDNNSGQGFDGGAGI